MTNAITTNPHAPTTVERVVQYAEDAAELLAIVARIVGGKHELGAEHALIAIEAALVRFQGSLFDGPITAEQRDKAIKDLKNKIAANNAAADAALDAKFDKSDALPALPSATPEAKP
jgi:hypothetical protein